MNSKNLKDIDELIKEANRIVILQADNPDGDSLSSSLALEQILGDMGKDPVLYCGVDMPTYLNYLPGWDRVVRELPPQFDASIIVDTSAWNLFEVLNKSTQKTWLSSRPNLVIDHHNVENTIPFATIVHNQPAVATTEVIYETAIRLKWPVNKAAATMLATGILSDSLGLTSEAVTARNVHILGELVEKGVSLAKLENARRESGRKTPEILKYKGQLLQRIEYHADGRVATVTIPWAEIERYSQDYNPSMLVIEEMRFVQGVQISIAFKTYTSGKVTGKVRSNFGFGIAGKLAEHFGGGGHAYASGFKITGGRTLEQIKSECVKVASELLDKIKAESTRETV